MSNQVAMSVYLSNDNTKKYLNSILGDRSGQFITSLTSLAGSSEMLKSCDRNSLLACALKAVSMDLPFDPNLGFTWCVPYGKTAPRSQSSHGVPIRADNFVATFQIGAKGYIQLALRTGQYKFIGSRDVREGEFLGRNFVGDPEIKWLSDEERINKKIIGYMAGLELLNGFRKIIFWSNQEVENHAIRYSQSYRKYKKTGNKSDAIWASQFEKMAEKTVLKALISKYGIMSTDMQKAVISDQTKLNINLETGEENINYIDNPEILETLSGDEQENLLEKYSADKITTALDKMKIESLNKLTKSDLETFKNIIENEEIKINAKNNKNI